MVPFKKATLKTYGRAALLSCSSCDMIFKRQSLLRCFLLAVGGRCADTWAASHKAQTHKAPPHKVPTEALDGQAETEFTFLDVDTEGEKVTANHKGTSAQ